MVGHFNKLIVVVMAIFLFAVTGCGNNLTDRDGNSYKTVKIGSQIWMAENLKVKTEDSWCYEDKESNCQKYGRLYNWEAAKTACPVGWHLPSKDEFETLLVAVGGKEIAGKKLKSTTGWKEHKGKDCNGDDAFGFSALPAGVWFFNKGHYNGEGKTAGFWGSTESDIFSAYNIILFGVIDLAKLDYYHKDLGISVRCLKD